MKRAKQTQDKEVVLDVNNRFVKGSPKARPADLVGKWDALVAEIRTRRASGEWVTCSIDVNCWHCMSGGCGTYDEEGGRKRLLGHAECKAGSTHVRFRVSTQRLGPDEYTWELARGIALADAKLFGEVPGAPEYGPKPAYWPSKYDQAEEACDRQPEGNSVGLMAKVKEGEQLVLPL